MTEDECWSISRASGSGEIGAMWAIAAGLLAIASATRSAARHLGNGNAATEMGAIERLSVAVGEIATAIRTHSAES